MDLNQYHHLSPKKYKIEFWKNYEAEIDLTEISNASVSVKGKTYNNVLRFMEIYGNISIRDLTSYTKNKIFRSPDYSGYLDFESEDVIEKIFMPHIPGVCVEIGENIPQPPFCWKECDARTLGVNFTYNTNAIYRILDNLVEQGGIAEKELDTLLDRACCILSAVYKHRDHSILKNINNNFNMFLISKVIEFLVGKKIYDSEQQELQITRKSLNEALILAQEHVSYNIIEKMGVALGKGISFIENRISISKDSKIDYREIQDISQQYYGCKLAIDHRQSLLDLISNIGQQNGSFILVTILDDASESVDDFLWMQDLLIQFPFLKIHALINTAQVSVNFSIHMLSNILNAHIFKELADRFDLQFCVSEIYCPFISFQTEYLTDGAKKIINRADAIFVKGANFFETCQIEEKDVFHAFVVYGPISCMYTGLSNYAAVFAYVPSCSSGYVHNSNSEKIIKLTDVCSNLERESKYCY